MANHVAHFAIYADDLDRAQAFYRGVFGWSFEPWGPPDFFLIKTNSEPDFGGATRGSLDKRRAPLEGEGINGYRCTVSVDSIEETMEKLREHGAELRSELVHIPSVGQVVEFYDTERNIVCAMQYDQELEIS